MRILKTLGIFVGIILLIAIIGIVLLLTLVSPNHLKPILTAEVKQKTGRELVMDGELSWTLFPYLGLKTGHISMSNPAGFHEPIFAEISHATVGVQLAPLLQGKIQSSGIFLTGMKLHLIKNAAGQTNWVFPHTVSNSEEKVKTKTTTQNPNFQLAVSGVDINNAEITWTDESANETVEISHFNFHAKNISFTQPIPISTDFHFLSKNPNGSGNVKLASQLTLNIEKQIYTLDNIDLSLQTKKNEQNITTHVTGDLVANLPEQTLQWKHFKATVADVNVVGNVNVLHLSSAPRAEGHFDIQPFDLKASLKKIGQDAAALQVAKNVMGSVDFSASAKTMTATGQIKAEEMEANHVKMENVNAHLDLKNGTLQLTPITATLYEGSLSANAALELSKPVVSYTLQGKLTHIQAGPLFKDLGATTKKLSLSGLANIDLQVKTEGRDSQSIVKHLNGTTHFTFTNGVLEGVDLGYYVDSASALVQNKSLTSADSHQTHFGSLTATGNILNGIITNNDLLLDATRFDTKGKGTINLVNQTIDYTLQASLKDSNVTVLKHYTGLMIPITISGSLDNPHVRLDTETLLKFVAKQQIEKHHDQIQKLEEKVQEKIQNKLSGKADDLLKNFIRN